MKIIIYQLFTILSFVLLSVLASSCQKELLSSVKDSSLALETKAGIESSGYIFNESAQVWMQREDDPYELSKIQTLAQERSISANVYPTHYAIKIYPRNEIELNAIIRMNDIIVSYIPFGYKYVPEDIAADLKSPYEFERYSDELKYSITREGSSAQTLPVLYVTWPVTKDLPDEYDYEIAYSACLPSTDNEDENNDGIDIANSLRGSSYRTISGFILDYDWLLSKYLAMKNLRIRVSYGLNSIETYTNNAGHFSITGNINDNATVSIVYENTQWRLTDVILITYVVSLGTVLDMWGTSSTTKVIRTNTTPQLLYRAAEYFFNGSHDVSTPPSNYCLQINMTESGDLGAFNANIFTNPWVEIRTTGSYEDQNFLMTLFHELGHFNHYKQTTILNYLNVPSLIKESFADYIKWYLSPEYYASNNNGIYGSSWDIYLFGDNQDWQNTEEEPFVFYSPLFIDLVDNYDQSTYSNMYNSDTVTGFSYDDIACMLPDISCWNDLRSLLQTSIYPTSVFNAFVAPYNEYFANN